MTVDAGANVDGDAEYETDMPAQGLPPLAITGSAATTEKIYFIENTFKKYASEEEENIVCAVSDINQSNSLC